MKLFGWTIHHGDCVKEIRIERKIIYEKGIDPRTDQQRVLALGHTWECAMVHAPNGYVKCTCGLDSARLKEELRK